MIFKKKKPKDPELAAKILVREVHGRHWQGKKDRPEPGLLLKVLKLNCHSEIEAKLKRQRKDALIRTMDLYFG